MCFKDKCQYWVYENKVELMSQPFFSKSKGFSMGREFGCVHVLALWSAARNVLLILLLGVWPCVLSGHECSLFQTLRVRMIELFAFLVNQSQMKLQLLAHVFIFQWVFTRVLSNINLAKNDATWQIHILRKPNFTFLTCFVIVQFCDVTKFGHHDTNGQMFMSLQLCVKT